MDPPALDLASKRSVEYSFPERTLNPNCEVGTGNRRPEKFIRFPRSERRVAARPRPVAWAPHHNGHGCFGVRVEASVGQSLSIMDNATSPGGD